jgi:hypothetical protein
VHQAVEDLSMAAHLVCFKNPKYKKLYGTEGSVDQVHFFDGIDYANSLRFVLALFETSQANRVPFKDQKVELEITMALIGYEEVIRGCPTFSKSNTDDFKESMKRRNFIKSFTQEILSHMPLVIKLTHLLKGLSSVTPPQESTGKPTKYQPRRYNPSTREAVRKLEFGRSRRLGPKLTGRMVFYKSKSTIQNKTGSKKTVHANRNEKKNQNPV